MLAKLSSRLHRDQWTLLKKASPGPCFPNVAAGGAERCSHSSILVWVPPGTLMAHVKPVTCSQGQADVLLLRGSIHPAEAKQQLWELLPTGAAAPSPAP